jgi:hypothetical protein
MTSESIYNSHLCYSMKESQIIAVYNMNTYGKVEV